MRPRDCRVACEDLTCLGCGEPLHRLPSGVCGYEEWEARERERERLAEEALYERLKLKHREAPQ